MAALAGQVVVHSGQVELGAVSAEPHAGVACCTVVYDTGLAVVVHGVGEKDLLHCCSNACYCACSCYSRVPLGKLLTSYVWKLHEVNSHPWVGGYCPEIILSSLFLLYRILFLILLL